MIPKSDRESFVLLFRLMSCVNKLAHNRHMPHAAGVALFAGAIAIASAVIGFTQCEQAHTRARKTSDFFLSCVCVIMRAMSHVKVYEN